MEKREPRKPGFMSQQHVQIMNRLLAADAETKAAAAKLPGPFVMAHELANGPGGRTVWWQMRFDPATGVSFTLTEPATPADLLFTGDWREVVQDLRDVRDGKKDQTGIRWVQSGDPGFMAIVGEAFAAAKKAAAVPADMDVPDSP
jgi:hypothetical protein